MGTWCWLLPFRGLIRETSKDPRGYIQQQFKPTFRPMLIHKHPKKHLLHPFAAWNLRKTAQCKRNTIDAVVNKNNAGKNMGPGHSRFSIQIHGIIQTIALLKAGQQNQTLVQRSNPRLHVTNSGVVYLPSPSSPPSHTNQKHRKEVLSNTSWCYRMLLFAVNGRLMSRRILFFFWARRDPTICLRSLDLFKKGN